LKSTQLRRSCQTRFEEGNVCLTLSLNLGDLTFLFSEDGQQFIDLIFGFFFSFLPCLDQYLTLPVLPPKSENTLSI